MSGIEMASGHQHALYVNWSDRIDQKHMSKDYAKLFNEEVEGDGFKRGARSFITTGFWANNNGEATYTCLIRGGYNAAYVDAYTLARRMDGQWVPGWTDDDDNKMTYAETVIITELFSSELLDAMSPKNKLDLIWFIVRCIEQDRVVVLTMPIDTDLNILGEAFGDFIEKNFEVFQDGKTTPAQTETKPRRGGNRGNAITRKHPKKRKRQNVT